jgi:hypothetical protein
VHICTNAIIVSFNKNLYFPMASNMLIRCIVPIVTLKPNIEVLQP